MELSVDICLYICDTDVIRTIVALGQLSLNKIEQPDVFIEFCEYKLVRTFRSRLSELIPISILWITWVLTVSDAISMRDTWIFVCPS